MPFVRLVILCGFSFTVLAAAMPWPASSGFAGGDGNCHDDKDVVCATGGPSGSACMQFKVGCRSAVVGWKVCTEGAGNVSAACENDPQCSTENHAERSGACGPG